MKRPLTSVTAVSGEGGGADIMGFDICLSYGDGWCVYGVCLFLSLVMPKRDSVMTQLRLLSI